MPFLLILALLLWPFSSGYADPAYPPDLYKVRKVPAWQYGEPRPADKPYVRPQPPAPPPPPQQPQSHLPSLEEYQPQESQAIKQPMATAGSSSRTCCRGTSGTPRWYAGISGLAVFLSDKDIKLSSPFPLSRYSDSYSTSVGYGIAGQIGYRVTSALRAEIEIAFRENELESINGAPPTLPNGTYSAQKSIAYMFNGYYDYYNSTSFIPYIGAGFGTAFVKAPVQYTDNSQFLKEWGLAYQLMAGISYQINIDYNPILFHLGYRYFTTDELTTHFKTIPITAKWENTSHNIELGGKFYF